MPIPLTDGPGHQVVASGEGIYYDLQDEVSVRSFDIRLTDHLNRPVDLKGRPPGATANLRKLTNNKNNYFLFLLLVVSLMRQIW